MVLEELSVSKAALRLGVTQSAVSHTLDKLRDALGDPLFVRAGRGIDATERARALEAPAKALLDDMKAMTNERLFDPTSEAMSFKIAANDYQREMVFPDLMRHARENEISLSLRLLPSGVPTAAMLREGRCDLLISPIRPDTGDIYQARLFDDEMGVCYDSSVRKKAPTLKQLGQCDFVDVDFGEGAADRMTPRGFAKRQPVVTVGNFAGLVSFIQGTDLVSVQPRLMGARTLKPLTVSRVPFKAGKFSMYMLWHRRSQLDPAHAWLRNEVQRIARINAA